MLGVAGEGAGAAPVGAGAAGGDLQNFCIAHGSELVQAVAVHYQRALGAQALQCGRHEAADGRRVDADEAIRRISRVQQRAQDVERRAHLGCQKTHTEIVMEQECALFIGQPCNTTSHDCYST